MSKAQIFQLLIVVLLFLNTMAFGAEETMEHRDGYCVVTFFLLGGLTYWIF